MFSIGLFLMPQSFPTGDFGWSNFCGVRLCIAVARDVNGTRYKTLMNATILMKIQRHFFPVFFLQKVPALMEHLNERWFLFLS